MKIGEFLYSEAMLTTDIEATSIVFSRLRFIPTCVSYDYLKKCFVCTGYSPLFREVQLGESIPRYSLNISTVLTEPSKEPNYSVSVEEIK